MQYVHIFHFFEFCKKTQVRAMCTSKVAVDEKPDGSRELVITGKFTNFEKMIFRFCTNQQIIKSLPKSINLV